MILSIFLYLLAIHISSFEECVSLLSIFIVFNNFFELYSFLYCIQILCHVYTVIYVYTCIYTYTYVNIYIVS